MANGWSLLIGLIIVIALSAAGWFFSPKGETQTIWRSTLLLTFAAAYIFWGITFLAQLNPLIAPKRSDWRVGYAPH